MASTRAVSAATSGIAIVADARASRASASASKPSATAARVIAAAADARDHAERGLGAGERRLDVEQRLHRDASPKIPLSASVVASASTIRDVTAPHRSKKTVSSVALEPHDEVPRDAVARAARQQRRPAFGRHERQDRIAIERRIVLEVDARVEVAQQAAHEQADGDVRRAGRSPPGAPGRIVSKQQSPSSDVPSRPKPVNAGGGSSGRAGGGA